jgi:hypothetical protein
MRALLWIVSVIAALWSGYWYVGSTAIERAATEWFANEAAAGRIAENDSLIVHGFPNRFDLTVEGLHLADPITGYGWRAPFAQAFMMTWKPWHLIAALPTGQIITTPNEDITLNNGRLQASLVLVPGTSLILDRITVAGSDLAAISTQGWSVSATKGQFSTRRIDNDGMIHEIWADLAEFSPDKAVLAALADTSELPPVIEDAHIDALARFSAPLDRHAADTQPHVTGVDVKEGLLRWGDLVLFARGKVQADANGLADGRIDLRLEQWRKLIPVLVATQVITAEVAPTVTRAMEALAAEGGNPDVLDVPLTFQSGWMALGPLPLGPAPRLN